MDETQIDTSPAGLVKLQQIINDNNNGVIQQLLNEIEEKKLSLKALGYVRPRYKTSDVEDASGEKSIPARKRASAK